MTIAAISLKYAAYLDAGLPVALGGAQLEPELRAIDPAARARFERRVAFGVELGVPLGAYLRQLAELDERARQNARELATAFAAPRATAKVVAGLPLASLLVAQMAGLRPFDALLGKPIAQIAAGLGAMLLAVGWLIMRRLISGAEPDSSDPAELLTLLAVALQSGLATRDCLAAAEREFAANGSGENGGEEAVAVRWQREQVEALTDLSFKTGVALSGLLNAAADARRSEVWAAQRQLIEKLGVRLMLPLGLVVLPAFVLIGIIPVVVGMLSGA